MPEARENSVYELLASLIAAFQDSSTQHFHCSDWNRFPFSCESHERLISPYTHGGEAIFELAFCQVRLLVFCQ